MAPEATAANAAHALRREALQRAMHAAHAGLGQNTAPLGLVKHSSNLFRARQEGHKNRLDLQDFCHVLDINPGEGWVDVEGLTTYDTLVAHTLAHGVMPAVVPQLKTITVGGAAAGVGIEATSFKAGLVHDTVLELDVLLPSGEVLHCTPHNAHQDLFYGFPNAYGTLGYALRLRLKTQPVHPFVKVKHLPFTQPAAFFKALADVSQSGAAFLDAVVFDPQQLVINVGTWSHHAPWLSDYTGQHIYYRSLPEKPMDFLTVAHYLWRWDTDWFWCSKNFMAQHPLVRRLLGPGRLNSQTYTRLMRWNARWGISRAVTRLRGLHAESVIQDVDLPLAHAAEFLDFLQREIQIKPIWVCPVRAPQGSGRFALFPLPAGQLWVNFGFWDVVTTQLRWEPGHFNRLVEGEVLRLGGIKSLYSESFFTPEAFDAAYGMAHYRALKAKYDPQGQLLGLYEKCVLRA